MVVQDISVKELKGLSKTSYYTRFFCSTEIPPRDAVTEEKKTALQFSTSFTELL